MNIKINEKRLLTLILSGFILLNATACKANLNSVNQNNPNNQNTGINEKMDTTNNENVDSIKNNPSINIEENITDKDTQMIAYFENLDNEVTSLVNSNDFENFKTKAKEIFIKTVDFIFYDEPINGITFDELKTETKTKILEIFKNVDSKIMVKWPNYKEDISSTVGNAYNTVLDKAKEYLNDLDSYIEDKIGTDTYNEIKDAYEDTKDVNDRNMDIIKDGLEGAKEKVKDWYQEFKNSN